MRRLATAAATGVTAVLALTLGATSAWAGTTGSAFGAFTLNGINYRTISVIHTNYGGSTYAQAETDIIPRNLPVGANKVQANARLFTSSGTLVSQSGFQSNPSTISASGVWDVFGTRRTAAGTYRSWGVVKAWSGTAFNAYYAFQSPNLATNTP